MAVEPVPVCGVAQMERTSRDDAVRGLYDALAPRLYRYCVRLVRDEQLASDLTQEAFASLLVRWVRVRDPEPYLFHVVTYQARAAVRRALREVELLSRAPWRHDASVLGHPHLALHLAVEQLPRRYRDVVLLHYFADLSTAQVAAAVGRPQGTVKRLLSEARTLLATALGDGDVGLDA